MTVSNLKVLVISIILSFLVACTSSKDYSKSSEAKQIMDKCYELAKSAFVFESRCADIDGDGNSTICLGIQVAGEGGFPKNMEEYSLNSEGIQDSHIFLMFRTALTRL